MEDKIEQTLVLIKPNAFGKHEFYSFILSKLASDPEEDKVSDKSTEESPRDTIAKQIKLPEFWLKKRETNGLTLVDAFLFTNAGRNLIETHYEEHQGKNFFEPLCDFMCKGKIFCLIYEGKNAVSVARAKMRVIRDTLCPGHKGPENYIHASDSIESAQKEIKLWKGALAGEIREMNC